MSAGAAILSNIFALGNPLPPPPSPQAHTFNTELACYSLPYGALGFVSHILTYWTLLCLWGGNRPLWPWRKASYSQFDVGLGGVSLITTVVLAIITLVKCRNTWQLLVIGVWKLSMSLLNGYTAFKVAYVVWKDPEGSKKKRDGLFSPWHFAIYIPGMLAGFAGLMSLVAQNIHQHRGVRKITIGFYVLVGVYLIIAVVAACSEACSTDKPTRRSNTQEKEDPSFWDQGFLVWLSIALFVLLAAFYSDWVLGMIAGNIVGIPSKDNSKFYWTYFAAKRLTMFSW